MTLSPAPSRTRPARHISCAFATIAALTAGSCLLAPCPARAQSNYNYAEALQKGLFFYEAQESGNPSPGNRVSWRGPAHTDDGADVSRDLSGGWYDAGDHWKSNYTMAYAASLLAWTGVQYRQVYNDKAQMVHLMRSLKHVNDYFLKCIVDPNPNDAANFSGYEIYIDIAGQPGPDPNVHSVWTAPEATAGLTKRESLKVNTTITGPDVAASMAAAMAASAIVFKQNGDAAQQAYADTLLQRAKKLQAYAEAYPFNAQSLVSGKPQAITPSGAVREIQYRDSNVHDDRLWAKLWLHRASKVFNVSGYTSAYLDSARNQVNVLETAGTPLWDQFGWWRDLFIGQYPHAVLMLWLQVTDQPADVTRFEGLLFDHLKAWDELPATPGGLKVRQEYGGNFALKWSLNQCYLAMMYSDWTTDATRKARFYNYAKSQMDYALGDNPINTSFVIGFGAKGWPQSCHHRGAHGWWGGFESITNTNAYYKPSNRHTLYGGLMAGPKYGSWQTVNGQSTFVRFDQYEANFDHYMNEVALDFNAGMQGVVCGLVARNPSAYSPLADFPQPEPRNSSLDWKTTDMQYFVVARQAASTANSVQIEAWAHNQSAWPARVTRNLAFRYYFTLDAGVNASNVSAAINSSQGATVGPVTQFSGSTYYVEVKFPNTPITPNRIYQVTNRPGGAGLPDDLFRRSVTFTLSTSAGTWDNSNDFSYSGMDANSTIRPNIPVYENGTKLEGNEPSGTVPTGTGSIVYEYWSNVNGTGISAIPTGTTPSGTITLTSFEGPTNRADNYGARIRGYLTAPLTGSYTFWVAGDDNTELWLSTTDQPANKVRIAYHNDWTNSREWNKYATQKSAPVSLTAGQRYYVEALVKEGGGGDNIAAGWAKPGQATTAPSEVIPGSALSPFTAPALVDRTTTPGGGTITARARINTSEDEFKAFDDNANTKWLDNAGTPTAAAPSWIQYAFAGSGYAVTKYSITSANDDYGRDPKDWRLLGSNDGASWTPLDTRTGETFASRFQKKEYTFSNATVYKYYRLEITANSGGATMTQLSEIELFSN